LRSDPDTGARGVTKQEAAKGNQYNHNYQNRFCVCGEEYDAETEKGTMFQCLGLGTVETGGCGEDWYHPECLMGLERDWYKRPNPQTRRLMTLGKTKAQRERALIPRRQGFPTKTTLTH